MVDTHAHLNWPEFAENIDCVVAGSKIAGLSGIVIASSNLADSQVSIELAKKYPDYLFASVGIHPQQTDPENSDSINGQLNQLNRLIAAHRPLITSIGECGLDYSPAPPPEKDRTKVDQELLFRGQIELALKYQLPLIIHARQANDEAIEILKSYQPSISANYQLLITNYCPSGVFHCYSGGKKRIQKILDLPAKWYFGFDGNLTYDEGLQQVIKEIPSDRILIETDSPLLTPLPYRGQPNKPAYLTYIQQAVNHIFNTDLTAQIVANSVSLFRLPITNN